MGLKFGTSGVRGLVTEMTDFECYSFATAFCRYLKAKTDSRRVSLAGDYRSSTPRITQAVRQGLEDGQFEVEYCGRIPTPALTFRGLLRKQASVMVTGSHIPDDRNGIKFNMPWGEILKPDETEIARLYRALKQEAESRSLFDEKGTFLTAPLPIPEASMTAAREFESRYLGFFPSGCLDGSRVVVYEHSSVARDILVSILAGLGARPVRVGRSDDFVAVDTEAVQNRKLLAEWVLEHEAAALVSADGDGDRPLLVDETGQTVPGDILGILTSRYLDADSISVPVSCNSALEQMDFVDVQRTRIGSPWVIQAIQEATRRGAKTAVGFEANGGFLTGSEITSKDGRKLAPLPTRDSVLPLLATLHLARQSGSSISALRRQLPARYTCSGLIRQFPGEIGQEIVRSFSQDGPTRAVELFGGLELGDPVSVDLTDGARIGFSHGSIIHLRPSGNAPEFRCYTEAGSQQRADQINRLALNIVRSRFRTEGSAGEG